MANVFEIPVMFSVEAGDAPQAAATLRKLLAQLVQAEVWKERYSTVTMMSPPEDGSTAKTAA